MGNIYDYISENIESAKVIARMYEGEEAIVINSIVVYPNKQIVKGSNVFEGTHGRDSLAAIKVLSMDEFNARREGHINQRFARFGSNILRFYSVERDENWMYFAMELCECSLDQLLEDDQVYENLFSPFPSPALTALMRGIVAGLEHLHASGVVHRDLNPSHVLVVDKIGLCPKLSGFGRSRRLAASDATGTSGLQLLYHPSGDVFRLGCLLFHIFTRGRLPFGECVDLSLVEHIPEAADLFRLLLNPEPKLRPKASEVLLHPLLWDSLKRLSFLKAASWRIKVKDRDTRRIVKALKASASLAFRGTLDGSLDCAAIITQKIPHMKQYRPLRANNVRYLLHLIQVSVKNLLSEELRDVLGTFPEGFDCYFRLRFPNLLMVVYNVMHGHCKKEGWFREYLGPTPV